MILWLAMPTQVGPRLWLGAEVGVRRNQVLLKALLQRVRASALCRRLLFCVDGFNAYLKAIQDTFRELLPTGGRPRLRPWDGIHIAQVVKPYSGRCVVGVMRRIYQGPTAQVAALATTRQRGSPRAGRSPITHHPSRIHHIYHRHSFHRRPAHNGKACDDRLTVLPSQAGNLQYTQAQHSLFFGRQGGFFEFGNPLHVFDGADDADRHFDAAFGDVAQLLHRAHQELAHFVIYAGGAQKSG